MFFWDLFLAALKRRCAAVILRRALAAIVQFVGCFVVSSFGGSLWASLVPPGALWESFWATLGATLVSSHWRSWGSSGAPWAALGVHLHRPYGSFGGIRADLGGV